MLVALCKSKCLADTYGKKLEDRLKIEPNRMGCTKGL